MPQIKAQVCLFEILKQTLWLNDLPAAKDAGKMFKNYYF